MSELPGLTSDGHWDLPEDLNMAAQCLAHDPSRTAAIDLTGPRRRDVSFGELEAMAAHVAECLRPRISAGDRVGVLLSQSPWCLASHLAIWALGAVSVPLFKLFKFGALQPRVADSGCEIVLTDPAGADLLADLAEAWVIEGEGLRGFANPDLQSSQCKLQIAKTGPETPAILIYTSGTTGAPKGALHGHRILTGHLPGVSLSHDFLGAADDVLWTPADWAWIGGLFDVAMVGLALGVPVVAARLDKFTPDAAADICTQARVRNVFFPPTALRMLKSSGARLSGLRSVASGGEPLGAEMLAWGRDAFGVTINEFYGQTECNMVASSCSAAFEPKPGCIGKPVPGFELAVVDQHGQPCQTEGDVAVRRGAASMMLGYWNRPDATAKKFRGDWMITGDRGIWDRDYLRFIGREDDVITSAGYRIGPSEIEDCLMTHPDVATVGVVGKPDPVRTEIVKAYVVPKAGCKVSVRNLQSWVQDRLASYSYPREIEFLDALPMTVTGKVIRKDLKARAAAEKGP